MDPYWIGPTGTYGPLHFAKLLILWWAQQDSNLRLPPCEGGTLPLSYAPLIAVEG
jgi:hypothetical protein